VNHEILMRVGNGRADFAKEHEAFIDGQPVMITKLVDGFALNIFHGDKRQAVGRAPINQTGDVRMIERGQDIALHRETADDGVSVHAPLDNL
jgi:hypothetical protein